MSSIKYFDRLLIIAVVFIIFLVITMVGIPLLMEVCHFEKDSRNGTLILSTVQAFILFIFPSLISARIISRNPAEYLMLSTPPRWLPLLGVIFAYLLALPALNQLIFWNANISFPDSIAHWGETFREIEENADIRTSNMLNTKSFGAMIINLIVVGLITAFAEEMFFRGTAQRTAGSNGYHHTSIWVVAILFSMMHCSVFGFIPRLILGAWFGYLLYWTKSLYVPVFAHFLNNGMVVVFAWLTANGFKFNLDKFGVVETGFPLPAFVSSVAVVVFLVYFRYFFFMSSDTRSKINYA